MLRTFFPVTWNSLSMFFFSFFIIIAKPHMRSQQKQKDKLITLPFYVTKKILIFYTSCTWFFLFFISPLQSAYAASITYTGDGTLLQNTPSWIGYPKGQVLFPGNTAAPEISANDITIDFSSGIAPTGVFGGLSVSNDSKDNTVTIKNGLVTGTIYGGYVKSGAGSADNNSVIVENGTIQASIIGGQADTGTGTANGNTLVINDNVTVKNGIIGGEARDGEASGNSIIVQGASLGQSVWGGISNNNLASKNTIHITDSTVTAEVYGGSSYANDATKNEVTLINTTVYSDHNIGVNGGFASTGNAIENSVIMSGTTTAKDVSGGKSITGSTIGNKVTLSDVVTAKSVSGGMVIEGSGDARGNSVTMTGGTVTGNISGGRVIKLSDGVITPTGNAIANSLTISGGTVKEAAFGGQSSLGYAKSNNVTISGTAKLLTNLFGGYSQGAYVEGNTVSLQGGEVSGSVYGGRSDSSYAQSNTVTMESGKVGSIFGAYAPQNYAANNNIIIKGGTITGAAYGARSDTNTATNNSVTMEAGVVSYIYGAYAAAGNANANSVYVKSGNVIGDIYGGRSVSGATTNNNSVVIGSTAVVGSNVNSLVYGGYNPGGAANNNSVTVNGGKVVGSIYGAYGKTQANANTVTLNGGQATSIVGGYSSSGNANNNNVSINGSTITGNIFGGYAHSERDAINNTISISGAANLASATLVGGFQGIGTGNIFSGNTLNINGFKGNVKGIMNFEKFNFAMLSPLQNGETILNVLGAGPTNIANCTVEANFSKNSFALDVGKNITLINATTGGLVGNINRETTTGTNKNEGIWTYTLSTANNKLNLFVNKLETNNLTADTTYTIAAGAEANQWVALKVNNNFTVKDLTITSNNNQTASLSVGGTMAVDNLVITQNTAPISVNVNTLDVAAQNTQLILNNTAAWNGSTGIFFSTIDLGEKKTFGIAGNGNLGFNQLNVLGKDATWDGNLNAAEKKIVFFIPPNADKNTTMLTVTGVKPTNITNANISTHIAGNAPALAVGDKIHLISTSSGLLSGTPSCAIGSQGISLLYDFNVLQADHELYLEVHQVSLNPKVKALSEGKILGLAFVSQGANLLAEEGVPALKSSAKSSARVIPENKTIAFGTISGNHSRLNTGSHIDAKGVSLVTGIGWSTPLPVNALLFGTFFETGKGNYHSYNSFMNTASVEGSGDTEYYGGGVMGRYDINQGLLTGLYTEASLRAGYASTNFSSNDLRSDTAQNTQYDSGALYYGAHAGIGYIWEWKEKSSFDFSTKYLWTHQQADKVAVADDSVTFKESDSQRWCNGARLTYEVTQQFTPYIGARWEYEFAGEAKASIKSYNIDPPSLKGSTVIGELGAALRPAEDSNVTLNFGIQTYTGKREGVSGNFAVEYNF